MKITRVLPVLLLVAVSLVLVPASNATASSQLAIATGGQHSCAITSAGTVHCWGDNTSGQATDQIDTTYSAIAAGGQFSCAITFAGTVHCWGNNTNGQATDQTDTTYTEMAAGNQHACAISVAGTVHCWGNNASGQATDQTGTTYTAIAAGGQHSCAITAAGTVHCWGDNTSGQATDQTTTTYREVAAGSQHSCAITTADTVHCWGNNASGQATDQTDTTYTAIAAGGQHSCALTTAGTVHCWGNNSNGQATDQTDTTYTAVAAGGQHSCAITSADTVHCWGDNTSGQAPASLTPMTVPGPPTGVAGTAGNAQVALTWSAPANDGGWAITDYEVSVYDSSGGAATGVSGATTRTAGSAATSYTFSGLTNGTAYTFKVAAVSAAGTGPQSDPSAPVTPLTVPGAPTAVAGTAGDGQVALTWAAPAGNGGAAITDYQVSVYNSSGGAASGVAGATTRAVGSAGTSYTFSGLTNGTSYTFRVAAVNAAGTGAQSALSAVVVPHTVSTAPTAVTGTPGNGQVALTWTTPASNGGQPITNYQVRVYNGSGGAPSGVTGATTRTVGSAATSYTFSALTNGTAYTFRVAAVNAAGTGPQSALSAAVIPRTFAGAPPAPAVTTGSGQVALTWSAPAGNGGAAITNYQVSVYDSSGGAPSGVTGAVTRAVGSAATSYTFSGLTNGTAYTFRVAAVNAAGTGAQSALSGSLVVGAPAPPTAVKTVQVAAGSLRVSFAPGVDNGSAITKFSATCTSTNGGALRNASGTASPITVTALTNGKTYTCAVRATNARGTGLPSTSSATVVVDAPGGVSATAGDATAVVSWSAPPSGSGGPITGYDVTVAPGGRVVSVSDPYAVSANVTALTNGTAYTFTVAARTASGPGPPSVASAPVKPHVTASIGDASVYEGTGFPVTASFSVTLREPAREAVSIAYASVPGTASAGSDYTAVSGAASFTVGQTTKLIAVTVLGDSTVEPTETFTVKLSNPTNAILGQATGLGTIRDDDSWSGQSIAVSDATVNEGDVGNRTVQLEIRAKVDTFPVSVSYSVIRGSAEYGEIVPPPPATLQLTGPNTLVSLSVKGDLLKEGDERFGVYISSPTIPVRQPRGVVTIVDNDLTVAPASPLFPTVTTSDVWTPPNPIPPGRPGDVIWSVPTSGTVPAGATTRTMLYRSRSALGDDVAISAWLTVPTGTPPAGGWPILAFGHWTLGMDDSCAPTRRLAPTYIPYINDFVAARYIVVAPDYEGLGTPGPTAYWAAESYAHSLLDSVRAAKNLVPDASNHAVLFGGSEGGLAATAAAELWPYYAPEIDLRGAVGSGPGVATSFAQTIAVRNANGFGGNSLAMIAGQNNAYPTAGIPSYFLTSAGIQALQNVQTICSDQYASYGNAAGLFQPWLSADPLVPPPMSAVLASATDRDTLLRRAPAVPVFYAHGRQDMNFPPVLLPPFVQGLCDLGTTVKLSWYNEGHMPFTTSRSDVLAWISARFAGSAAPTSCGNIPHAENIPPTVSSIVVAAANPNNAASVSWTVRFSESVTGVAKANFSLASTGPTGASVTGVSGTGNTRTVTASTGSGNGDLRLNLSNTSGIIDAAANPLSTTFNGTAYTIDKTAPSVVSITRADPTPTGATSVNWTVTFDESVTGVATSNFSLSGTSASSASITGISGTGTTRTVTASTGLPGTLGLDLTDPSGVRDLAGNAQSNTTTGEQYLIQ